MLYCAWDRTESPAFSSKKLLPRVSWQHLQSMGMFWPQNWWPCKGHSFVAPLLFPASLPLSLLPLACMELLKHQTWCSGLRIWNETLLSRGSRHALPPTHLSAAASSASTKTWKSSCPCLSLTVGGSSWRPRVLQPDSEPLSLALANPRAPPCEPNWIQMCKQITG